ncbi:MAG: TetR/AcrR family transcriptional regulator [Nocardioides sp.]
MGRREELLDQAADYVLESGLIGLSLRPLAAAVGTSDRMLLYHFGSRDDLVTDIIATISDRSVELLRSLEPATSVHDGVLRLWDSFRREPMSSCQQIYLQAAASGLLGEEPYRSGICRANRRWATALEAWLASSGAPSDTVGQVTKLVDSAMLGFHVDLALDPPESFDQPARDLAAAAQALADGRLSRSSARPSARPSARSVSPTG